MIAVWALIDAAVRPTTAFQAAGQNKVLWVVLPIVGLFFFGLFGLGLIGGILGSVYLGAIRPQVQVSPALLSTPSVGASRGTAELQDGRSAHLFEHLGRVAIRFHAVPGPLAPCRPHR